MAGSGINNISAGQPGIPGAGNQVGIYNALIPPEGPKALGFKLDFIDFQTNVIDFTYAYGQRIITILQSVYVDNSLNTAPVTVTCENAPFWSVTLEAGWQGTFAVVAPVRPKFQVSTTGSCIVNMIWMNVPIPENTWPTGAAASSGSAPVGAGTITVPTGGTAVTPFGAAFVFSNGGFISNPAEATENLFVDPVNTAGVTAPGTGGTTSEIFPGGSYTIPPGVKATVSVNAVTSGHAFTAIAWG